VAKRTAVVGLCGFVLLAVVCATAGLKNLGYSELPNGRGGTNVEATSFTKEMGFDKKRSLKAFQATVYPLLRANCSGCHSTENRTGTGAQAPLHADVDVNLAHEYALTRVNFREAKILSSWFVWASTGTIALPEVARPRTRRCWRL
jgi:hypothetical protein